MNKMLEGKDFWTYDDLQKLFRRQYLTIYLWRQEQGLPAIQISEKRVFFIKEQVLIWAQEHDKRCYFDDPSIRIGLPNPLPRRRIKLSRVDRYAVA